MLVHVTEPVLLVLEIDQTQLDVLRETLRRYGNEYSVQCEISAAAASARLAQFAADGHPVAIVCAPAAMIDTAGGEFLAMAPSAPAHTNTDRAVTSRSTPSRPAPGRPYSRSRTL
jgi:hypothetical protein